MNQINACCADCGIAVGDTLKMCKSCMYVRDHPPNNNMDDHHRMDGPYPAEDMPEGWTKILVRRKTKDIYDKFWFSPKESYKFNAGAWRYIIILLATIIGAVLTPSTDPLTQLLLSFAILLLHFSAVKVRRFLAVLDQVGGDEVTAYRLFLKKGWKVASIKRKAPTSDGRRGHAVDRAVAVHRPGISDAGSKECEKRLINVKNAMKKMKPHQEAIVLPPGFRVPCGFVVVYDRAPTVPTNNPSKLSMTPSAIRSREWRERQKKKNREEEGWPTNKKYANNVPPSYTTRRCSRTQT